MKANVPDELVLLGLSAAAGKPPTTDIYDFIDYSLEDHEAMIRALAAVLPAYEAMVRAKVAAEIEANAERVSPIGDWDPFGETVQQCLQIVRG